MREQPARHPHNSSGNTPNTHVTDGKHRTSFDDDDGGDSSGDDGDVHSMYTPAIDAAEVHLRRLRREGGAHRRAVRCALHAHRPVAWHSPLSEAEEAEVEEELAEMEYDIANGTAGMPYPEPQQGFQVPNANTMHLFKA